MAMKIVAIRYKRCRLNDATARASLAFYNTRDELDALGRAGDYLHGVHDGHLTREPLL